MYGMGWDTNGGICTAIAMQLRHARSRGGDAEHLHPLCYWMTRPAGRPGVLPC